MNRLQVLAVVPLLGLASCAGPGTPERPASVPASAVWAGTVEGGTWVDCKPEGAERYRYRCRSFFGSNGAMIADGAYVLRRRIWNAAGMRSELATPPRESLSKIERFDGRTIWLTGELVLVPDGTILYPSGPDGPQRQEYRLGEEVPAVAR